MTVSSSESLLLLDDDPDLLNAFRRRIGTRHRLCTFTRPVDALNAVRRDGPFAVIISDMRMPQMDGLSFLRKAERLFPESVGLILTGADEQQPAVAAVNSGYVFRFLKKPCSGDALFEAIDAAIQEYRRRGVRNGFQYRLIKRHSGSPDVEVQAGALAVTGYTGIDFAGRPQLWNEQILPQDRTNVTAFYACAWTGKPAAPLAYRMRHKNGTVIWVRNTLLNAHTAGQAEVWWLEGQIQDITAQKECQRQAEFLARFPEENPNPVLRVNPEGRIIYANDASGPLLDRWARQVGQIMPQDLYEMVIRVGQSGSSLAYEQRCGDHYYAIVFAPVRQTGDVNLYARDITKIKVAEQELRTINQTLREHDQLKSKFVSTVTHELRTPLCIFRNILSNALAGVHGSISRRLRDNLKMAQEEVERLSRIISDFLDISRIEAGTLQLDVEWCSINKLIIETCRSMKLLAAAKKIKIRTALPNEDCRARVDRDRIVQVMVNLIGNAIKFIPISGHITVSLEEDDRCCVIRVQDDGPGMAQDEINKVFDRFVQTKHLKGPGQHGTGLGLAISQELIRKHGGEIHVESRLGKGCTFWFTIPRHPEQPNRRPQENKVKTG